MPDAVRLPGTRQETLIAGPATVDEYLGVVRNQVQPATSFGVGWDHDRFPRGPTAGYRPGDPIDMPDREGAYPTWDTIRTRLWRNRAYFELAARTRGAVRQRDESMLELDPLENLTQQQLEELLATGATPTGFEVEHERIPQRVGAMLERAGLPAEQARRLAHVGDPSNLLPVRREQHAVWDEVARRWRTRNPTLERAFDDRDEFPLGSMREEEVQALLRALRQGGIDLSATQAGRELRGHLRIENERRGLQRRGGPWQIP